MSSARKGFKIDLAAKRKINKLARMVGCPLNWKRVPGWAWDTKDVGCAKMDASNVIHDIAHYAIATKAARHSFDFGLEVGPDSNFDYQPKVKYKPLYSSSLCRKIEIEASALGIFWEKKLGFNWQSTANYHNWNDLKDLSKAWKKLSRTINKYLV